MKKILSTVFTAFTLTMGVIVSFGPLNAQIPGLTQFTLNDGLPSNTIYDIAQDEKGNMIFATDYGLSKFDGVTFKNYTIEEGIPDNEILHLFKDSKNRIWYLGFNGKLGFLKDGKFNNETNNEFIKKIKFSTYIHDLHEDSNGNIWLLDSQYNLIVLSKDDKIIKRKKVIKFSASSHSYLIENKNKKVQLITFDKEPLVYNIDYNLEKIINKFNYNDYSAEIIEKIRRKRTSILRIADPISENINNNIINSKNYSENNLLYKTYHFNNNYWITSLNKGAYIFNENDFKNPLAILPNFQTSRAFKDRENNVWIGTVSNGVILFPDYNTTSYTFENQLNNDLYTVDILNGFIFLGNTTGTVTVLNEKTLEVVKTFNLTNSSNIIDRARSGKIFNNELHFLTNNNYIIFNGNLTSRRIISQDDKVAKELKHTSFKGVSSNDGYSHISSANGILGIDIKSKERKLIYKGRTTSVLLNKDTIWYGSTNGLNYIINQKTQKPTIPNNFNETIITDLGHFNDGIIIGTNSKGVGLYKNGELKVINKSNGLLSNSVKSIFIAKNNDLWISTNYGLNKVVVDANFKPITIESYTVSEGLNTNDVRNCYATESFAYVATSKGLNIIDIKSKRKPYEKPTVHLNEIILNNKLINPNDDTNFKSSNNNIQFNYSGISFKSIGHISFRYRLVGLEEEWITTTNNTVRYSGLPFGNYTFELMSVTKNNIECSNPVKYSFRIKRPFYHTWIFRIFILSTLIGGVYIWFLRRINKLKNQRKIDDQISNLRYQALNAQMNPHFINNLLTMIIELIDNGGKAKALSYLASFSQLVNLILRSTKLNLISLRNEIEIVTIYTQLGSLKFSEPLQLKINKDHLEEEDFDAIKLPPMILQPIIENCLRHAFTTDYKNPTIVIDFTIENDEFLIYTITDNGSGFDFSNSKTKTEGISLNNIEERLSLMADNKLNSETFINVTNISSEKPNLVGTKVELRIPLIYT